MQAGDLGARLGQDAVVDVTRGNHLDVVELPVQICPEIRLHRRQPVSRFDKGLEDEVLAGENTSQPVMPNPGPGLRLDGRCTKRQDDE